MIYLDSAATTKPKPEYLELYQKTHLNYWHNSNSPYQPGQRAEAVLELATERLAKALNVPKTHQILFTSGGTEANNFAIYGVCNNYLNQKGTIITTKIEHPSVLEPFVDFEKKGFKVYYLDVDSDGIVNLEQLQQVLSKDTILVSIQWVNNIVGAIQPIRKVCEILKKFPKAKLHVDGIQGIGKVEMDFNLQDVDLFTISAHKIHGLKASGALIYNSKLALSLPLKASSTQYPGTMDIGKAVVLAKAAEDALKNQKENYEKAHTLHRFLFRELAQIPTIAINGGINNYSPYLLNFSFLGKNSETVMHYLESFDIYVATGSACSSKLKKPQATVLAMTKDEARALSSIRVSLSNENTVEELRFLLDKLKLFCPEKQ